MVTPLTPFDAIVAGGGLTGVLAAARLALAHPDARILLVERETRLGGRMRSTDPAGGVHSHGLNAASAELLDLALQTLRSDPEAGEVDLAVLAPRRQATVGVLAGNRIVQADIELWFKPKGARTLGGLAAARQWPELEEILGLAGAPAAAAAPQRAGASAKTAAASTAGGDEHEHVDEHDDDEDDGEGDGAGSVKAQPFSHYWKKPRKAPATVVLEHFAAAIGIPDIWTASPQAIAERARFHSGRLHAGSWEAVIAALTALPSFQRGVTVKTGSMVGEAGFSKDSGLWSVETDSGVYEARALVVAQPPWQAITWLKRAQWPAHLLQVPGKSKPVTVVVLSDVIVGKPAAEAPLPDVTIVPSERVQIIRNGEREIAFQATIDFELSLQAPAVVKAVRSLKRARKKLLLLHPGLVAEGNHIALQAVAWAQSPAHADRKWTQKLDKKSFQSPTLAFCGDAYGAGYDGDGNVIASLASACQAVGATLAKAAAVPEAPIGVQISPDASPDLPSN